MKKVALILLILLISFSVFNGNGIANGWQSLNTQYFTIFYLPGFEEHAKEVLGILESYRPRLEQLTNNRRMHLPVVIDDVGMMSNGFADSLFYRSHLYWYPMAGLGAVEDWMTMVSIHEYAHILHMTNIGDPSKRFPRIMNNLALPNSFAPGWMHEGFAVYVESSFSNYQGRLNDGLYTAYIGARSKEGNLPSIFEATINPQGFHLDGIYTYGSSFIAFLANEYGEEKLAEFFTTHGRGKSSLNKSAVKVYGKPFAELWQDWVAYETDRFSGFFIDGERITKKGGNLNSPVLVSDGANISNLAYQKQRKVKANAYKTYTYHEIILRNLDDQTEEVIVSTTSPFCLPIRTRENKLYYGVREVGAGYANNIEKGFGLTAVLHEKDMITGKNQALFTAEIRAYDVLNDGRILYADARRDGFGSNLYFYHPDGSQELLYVLDYLIEEIAFSDDQIFMTAKEKHRNADIYRFSLADGELTPCTNTPYTEGGLTFAGNKLFFHANYNQVYSIYAYELTTNKVYKMTEGNYATHPAFDQQSNMLYFVGLQSEGFDLYTKEAFYEEVEQPVGLINSRSFYELEEVRAERKSGFSENLKTLVPRVTLPMFAEDDQQTYIGMTMLGQDAIGMMPTYDATIDYGLDDGKLGAEINTELNIIPRLSLDLGYKSRNQRPFRLAGNYNLLNRLAPGINRLSLGVSFNFGEEDGMEIVPKLFTRLSLPGTQIDWQFQMPFESKPRKTEKRRLGYYSNLQLKHNLGKGELLFNAQAIYDPQNTINVFPRIRGYSNVLAEKKGGIFSVGYERPLFSLNKGLGSWALGVYLEDLCGGLFLDTAVAKGNRQISIGAMLDQEMTVTFSGLTLKAAPGIGIGINGEKEPFYYFNIKL
ncbi:MAG TPA: hypothetical protein GXZ55_10510 [Natronincola sp.]|nr:hypothetical protein [Natronincola sp.]